MHRNIKAADLRKKQEKGAQVQRETRQVEIAGLCAIVDQIKAIGENDGSAAIVEAIHLLIKSLPKENDSPLLTEALNNLSIAIKKDHPTPQVTIEMPERQPYAYRVIRDDRGRADVIVPFRTDEVPNESC